MADSNPAPTTAEESEPQITFNVKSSSDAKYVLTLPAPTTVADLKQKLSTTEYANLPPERQRLIYSGRVLKDHDTIGSCKIKDGHTVHLVRGADSNQRQNPANQGGAATLPPTVAGQSANNVPSNIAAGPGAANPLAQLTGARYAGFHGLPGADMFGADGGMGAPPSSDQMLRMLDDPNFAQQMNEAMNNPAVINMLRENPMIRNNPMARAAIEDPELRRMMMNPDMIRMQMQMQRAMGGMPGAQGGGAFPMPGATDTTPQAEGTATATPGHANATGNAAQAPANPFAALFPGTGAGLGADGQRAAGAEGAAAGSQQSPFGNLMGGAGAGGRNNPMGSMMQQMMQNPQMMQSMMQMMGGGAGGEGAGAGADVGAGAGAGAFNPWAAMGGFGAPEPPRPADDRPPEVRYEDQLRQLNDMGFYAFEQNVQALRRSGGSVQGAVEYLLSNP